MITGPTVLGSFEAWKLELFPFHVLEVEFFVLTGGYVVDEVLVILVHSEIQNSR